jgi:hypothetical protein
MMNFIEYTAVWLLAPILAIANMARQMSHYTITSEKHAMIATDAYYHAVVCFDCIADLDLYGDWINLNEHYKNGTSKVVDSVKW